MLAGNDVKDLSANGADLGITAAGWPVPSQLKIQICGGARQGAILL